jgi:predicted nucleic acid-binding protein
VKILDTDILSAAITLASRAVLVTRNLKDFRQVARLRIENWAD